MVERLPNEIGLQSQISLQEQKKVFETLSQWGIKVKTEKLAEEAYVYGSVLYQKVFSRFSSDIDLFIVIPDEDDPFQNFDVLSKLRQELVGLSERICDNLLIESRKIVSVSTVTRYELHHGIHFARNSRAVYSVNRYRPVTSLLENEESEIAIGEPLSEEFLTTGFPVWAMIAEAQSHRDELVNGPDLTDALTLEHWPPKIISRAAYYLKHFDAGDDAPLEGEDSIGQGARHFLTMTEESEARVRNFFDMILDERTSRDGYDKVKALFMAFHLIATQAQRSAETLIRQKSQTLLSQSDNVFFREIIQSSGANWRCIDNCLELCRLSDEKNTGKLILTMKEHELNRSLKEDPPNIEDRLRFATAWEGGVRQVLTDAANNFPPTHQGFIASFKVCVSSIDSSHTLMPHKTDCALPENPLITVSPVNYWVFRNLNEEVCANRGNTRLQALRIEHLGMILKSGSNIYRFQWPSQLFIETVIILKDGTIPIFKKENSPMAKGRRTPISTCGTEVGLNWDSKQLEFGTTEITISYTTIASASLEQELKIDQNRHVKSCLLRSIVMQQAHLNCAVVVIVNLDMDEYQFRQHFDQTRQSNERRVYTNDLEFIRIDGILNRIHLDKSKGIWHQTGLYRLDEARQYLNINR
jgi:predicted nucleotidyltransferase